MTLDLTTASRQKLIGLGRKFPHAGASVLNRGLRTLRTAISSEIRMGYNLKKRDIDKHLKISQRATSKNLEARMSVSGESLPVAFFGPKTVKKKGGGVTFKVKKGGSRQQLPNAFIATMRHGLNVFVRTTKARGPVKALYSINIMKLARGKHINALIQRFMEGKFIELLRHELKFRLSRANTSGASGTFGSQGEMISR